MLALNRWQTVEDLEPGAALYPATLRTAFWHQLVMATGNSRPRLRMQNKFLLGTAMVLDKLLVIRRLC